MRKIFLYAVLIIILFSVVNQLKALWESNEKSLDATVSDVKEGIFSWYKKATITSKELKETLTQNLQSAKTRYEKLKKDIDDISNTITEKKKELDQTIKEFDEAKTALDKLMEKEKEEAEKTETQKTAVPTP